MHVNRLNAIVENLLSLPRIERTDDNIETELDFTETCIGDIIQTAIQACQDRAEEKKLPLNGERAGFEGPGRRHAS